MENETYQIMKFEDIPYLSKNKINQSIISFEKRQAQVSELYDLCLTTNCKDKLLLFYKSLLYYDIISFQCRMNPNAAFNTDLSVFNSFYLGIKFTQNQVNIPAINQLKHFNKKNPLIDYNAFIINEIFCVQLLNYKMAYSSVYDFLIMNLEDKPLILEKAKEYLEKIIHHQLFLSYSPYIIACGLVAYALNSQSKRDSLLMRKFCVNKEGTCYQLIVKYISLLL